MDIATIELEELKAKLDRDDPLRLVMTLNAWAFQAQHIPGSEYFETPKAAMESLGVDEEIVVYCSDPACVASQYAYKALVHAGYTNVRRYAGGLSQWAAAGYPLIGVDTP